MSPPRQLVFLTKMAYRYHSLIPRESVVSVSRVLAFSVAIAIVVLATPWTRASAAAAHAVAVLSFLRGGEVDIAHRDTSVVAGTLHAPLVVGDAIGTDDTAYAEVALTPHEYIRLAGGSDVRLASLSTSHRRLQIANGTIEVRVLCCARGATLDIDTPSLTLRPMAAGRYRITVGANNDVTSVTVRSGRLRVLMPGAQQELGSGVTEISSVARGRSRRRALAASLPDDFDRFCSGRDRAVALHGDHQMKTKRIVSHRATVHRLAPIAVQQRFVETFAHHPVFRSGSLPRVSAPRLPAPRLPMRKASVAPAPHQPVRYLEPTPVQVIPPMPRSPHLKG